ncbi:MAG: right-handed parallel beta-helix repeat-containing protein, partial [Candidatus Omnitrophica bacterium]|nr:right-handed parallel beta-helix repeat-containing protein [Candidatus Omnitrophota bacterium]
MEQAALTIGRCTVTGNKLPNASATSSTGSGIYALNNATLLVQNSIVADNEPAGIDCGSGCNLRVINSVVARNLGSSVFGYAAGIIFSSEGSCTINGSTIVGNHAGGIYFGGNGPQKIENSIFWNFGPEIARGQPEVYACCVRNGYAGTQVVSDYPEFVDPTSGDWRLRNGSPLIDRGENDRVAEGVLSDIEGNPRIRGDSVDLGAYESPANYSQGPVDTTPERFFVRHESSSKLGRSWGDAFPTVWEALFESLPGGEVWVASGTYREAIALPSNVAVYGGFLGMEEELSERNMESATTVIDATGWLLPAAQAISAQGLALDGLTFRNGSAYRGGGLNLEQSGATIQNCRFENNSAISLGGGVSLTSSSASIIDCDFLQNRSPGIPSGGNISNGAGGGIYLNTTLDDVTIKRCRFIGNIAGQFASGIYVSGQPVQALTIEDCEFHRNGGSHDIFDGTVIRARTGNTLTILNSQFTENFGTSNLTFLRGGVIGSQVHRSDVALSNCEISGNTGMHGLYMNQVVIQGSTISHNEGRGVDALDALIENSIIEGNGYEGVYLLGGASGQIKQSVIKGNGIQPPIVNLPSTAGGINARVDDLLISGCRIFGNTGTRDTAAAALLNGARVQIRNTEVYGNTSTMAEHYSVGGISITADEIEIENLTATANQALETAFTHFPSVD